MNKISVMLVDDHSVVRAGLRLLLESEGDIAVVGEAADGMEAVAKAKEIVPDVIVMDITMPKLNGLEAARQIRRDNEKVAILFRLSLSSSFDGSDLLECFPAQAHGLR